jgi:uncharacterized protein (DUF1499 family)
MNRLSTLTALFAFLTSYSLLASSAPFDACPKSPNCVSSDSGNELHAIDSIYAIDSIQDTWRKIILYIEKTPRLKIIEINNTYIKAEATSLIFRFTDDVEFDQRPFSSSIAVRSASRIGHSDFGVNRKRIERLRKHLQAN